MKAIRFARTGGPEVLELVEDEPTPPSAGQVLVEVSVAGVNFRDLNHRTGTQPVSLPSGIGLEGVGRVVEVGEGVEELRVGQRVAWCDRLGSYATHVTLAADRCVPVPDRLDGDVACGLMLQGITAHYLTRTTFPVGPDTSVLIHAASGGVGRLLVQLAVRAGATVVATTSSPAKAEEVRELGAQVVLDRTVDDVVARTREATGGVDVVYDSVGATTWDASLASLRPRGLAVLFGTASGPVPTIAVSALADGGSLKATRPRLVDHISTSEELRARAEELFGLAMDQELSVHVHERYHLPEAARAQTDLESGRTAGKLLIYP
jgi:NADPH2:quinone reductase